MAVQRAQQQNALAQMQMEQAQREVEQQNNLRQLLPTMRSEDRQQLLGYGQAGRQVYESLLKGDEEARKARKEEADTAAVLIKQSRDLLPSVTTPETYANWRAYTLKNLPGLSNLIPEQYTPEGVRGLMLEADKALEQHFVTQDLGGGKQVLSMPKYGGGPAAVVPGSAAATLPLPRDVEAQKARIALAGRSPAQPPQPQPPVAVVDPQTGKSVLVSREEAIKNRMTPAAAMEGLAPKERQAREAKFPQATTAVKTFESATDTLIHDLQKLANHPGLSSITGIAAGRIPGITSAGREAEALFDKIVARGGFQELQNMRNASPTGGALGNVSNQEGVQLRQSFAALDRRQDAPSVRKAIDDAIAQLQGSKSRVREAYDLTYDYKQGGAAPPPPAGGADLAAERANARAAIASGAPEAAVRKRFKDKTGQEL
jgi:hypothetical protein